MENKQQRILQMEKSTGNSAFPSQEKKPIAPIPRILTFPEVFHELMACFSLTHEHVLGMDLLHFWEQVEVSLPKVSPIPILTPCHQFQAGSGQSHFHS